jgi:hypothetical protein
MYLYIPVQLCSLVNTFNYKCICISLCSSAHWSILLITNVSLYIPVQLYGEESVGPGIPHSHLWMEAGYNLHMAPPTVGPLRSVLKECRDLQTAS